MDVDNLQSSPEQLKNVRRRRKRRSDSRKTDGWWRQYGLRGLFAALVVAAIVCFINPLRWIIAETDRASLLQDLVFNGGMLLIGLVILVFAAILGVRLVRAATLENKANWARSGCPNCNQTDLKRTERRSRHVMVERLTRIPYRRYICSDCKWKGLRIDQSRIVK